jgi:hypothetical protein
LAIAEMLVGDERLKFLDHLPFVVRLPLGLLGGFSAIGIIALWLGMIWDCAITSELPIWSRVKWLILLVLTNMLGALLYYFRVFRNRPTTVQA